eukprot:GHRQ01021836.1.p1 GENE.GHRQ01021836.1~~GHRQ01021836.1.p1  ORF type:complete len:116 (+),score=57.43 GHRQ01021836.1:519-866(+)
MAWDPQGSRLAVVLTQPHTAAGTVALYSTTHKPVVECSLIGFAQPGPAPGADEQQGGDAAEGSRVAAAAGHDSSSGSVRLHAAFAPVAGKARAVLSVGLSQGGSWGLVRNIPMHF